MRSVKHLPCSLDLFSCYFHVFGLRKRSWKMTAVQFGHWSRTVPICLNVFLFNWLHHWVILIYLIRTKTVVSLISLNKSWIKKINRVSEKYLYNAKRTILWVISQYGLICKDPSFRNWRWFSEKFEMFTNNCQFHQLLLTIFGTRLSTVNCSYLVTY